MWLPFWEIDLCLFFPPRKTVERHFGLWYLLITVWYNDSSHSVPFPFGIDDVVSPSWLQFRRLKDENN